MKRIEILTAFLKKHKVLRAFTKELLRHENFESLENLVLEDWTPSMLGGAFLWRDEPTKHHMFWADLDNEWNILFRDESYEDIEA